MSAKNNKGFSKEAKKLIKEVANQNAIEIIENRGQLIIPKYSQKQLERALDKFIGKNKVR